MSLHMSNEDLQEIIVDVVGEQPGGQRPTACDAIDIVLDRHPDLDEPVLQVALMALLSEHEIELDEDLRLRLPIKIIMIKPLCSQDRGETND